MKTDEKQVEGVAGKGRFSRRVRSLLLAGVVAVVASVAVGYGGPGRAASNAPLTGATLTASSSPTCSTSAFCIIGGAVSTQLFPGGVTPTLPITFVNPYNVPITITTLQVSFTNNFPPSCSPSAFQVNGTGAVGTPPSVTISPNFTVAKATTSGPTSATYTGALLGLANQGNQTTCEGLGLVLSYTATATYNYTNCVTGSQAGGPVTSGQVVCVSKGGKLTGGVTVQSGGVLFVNGGTVTGGINASGAAGINLCAASITGGASISGASGEVVIGDGQACAGGSITGGLSVTNGTSGVQIIGNSISGGLTVTGNTGSIPGPGGTSGQFIESNSISGGFTCTPNNTPALSDGSGAHPNSVNGQRTGTQCAGGF